MIGLGTYAFFWQHSERAPQPLDVTGMLRRTHELNGKVFQICDYPAIQACSVSGLRQIRDLAGELGIVLELGTKGISTAHLDSYLRLAESLDVRLVRSMVNTPEHRPGFGEAERLLRAAMPAWESAGVSLALETYEQLPSGVLVELVEAVGSPNLGICLDPANCVAALEHPKAVIDRCAPYVKNLHVKDFAFTRRGGWVGFTLEGVELGTGLLDLAYLLQTVQPAARGINCIIEHWLTWHEDFAETARLENLWNARNLDCLRQAVQDCCVLTPGAGKVEA